MKTINIPEQWTKKEETEFFESFIACLPKDSYIAMSLKGIERFVLENITCDFARNPVEELDSLYTSYQGLKTENQTLQGRLDLSEKECDNLSLALKDAREKHDKYVADMTGELSFFQDKVLTQQSEIEKMAQTIIELKAKIYDLITK